MKHFFRKPPNYLFWRNENAYIQIHMEVQEDSGSENNLEKEKQSQRNHTWYKMSLQSFYNQNSVGLAAV